MLKLCELSGTLEVRVKNMHKLRAILGVFVASILVVQAIFIGAAQAAGSAVVTVEPSAASVNTNSNVNLRFYVTPSGASIYSVQFNVNLSNLTFVSYSAGGTFAQNFVQSGGTAGSTSFQIVSSHSGVNSSSSKAYIGQVTVKASASAGTGSINISGVVAYDSNLDGMSASGQAGSVTIISPPASGGGGSSNPGSGGGGSPQPTTPSGNVTQNPNPDSTVAIPNEDGSEAVIISEEELANVLDEDSESGTDTEKESTEKPKPISIDFKKILLYALPVALVGLLGFLGYRFWDYRRNSKFHPPVSPPVDPTATTTPTVAPNSPSTTPPVPPAAPPASSAPISQEPTIITPQTQPTPPEQTNGSSTDGKIPQ